MKTARYMLEAALLHLLLAIFRMMPLDMASAIGGKLGRALGPFTRAQRTAQKNLAMAFPERSEEERARILTGMWDHLGRAGVELAHFGGMAGLISRLEERGIEHIPPAGTPAIFFSGHIGHWDLTYPPLHRRGIPVVLIYRHANNPFVDRMIIRMRRQHSSGSLVKGAGGSVRMMRVLKSGESLAMLVDQKMNEGIAVPFFGRDAMTAPAIAKLALRHGLPLIPVRNERLGGAHFSTTYFPPLQYENTGDEDKDVPALMTAINRLLESWIRERPEQWFWVHQRWPKA